jgi:hypothetical protein
VVLAVFETITGQLINANAVEGLLVLVMKIFDVAVIETPEITDVPAVPEEENPLE